MELQLFHRILFYFLIIIHTHYYLHQLTQHIHALYLSVETVRSGHGIPDIRKPAIQFLIGLFFVLQTTHQSAADT